MYFFFFCFFHKFFCLYNEKGSIFLHQECFVYFLFYFFFFFKSMNLGNSWRVWSSLRSWSENRSIDKRQYPCNPREEEEWRKKKKTKQKKKMLAIWIRGWKIKFVLLGCPSKKLVTKHYFHHHQQGQLLLILLRIFPQIDYTA